MAFRVYNSLTRSKEEVVPIRPGTIRLYTCGPTVYNFAHIGNFRAYVFEDVLRRYLKYKGFKVVQVMNLTDVDDKTIKGSRESGLSLDDYTAPFKLAFFEDVKTLRIEPAEYYPSATAYIREMIQIIEVLIEKGFAYKSEDGSVYFHIKHFADYGNLSHVSLENLKAGARVSQDEYEKESASDFALWKAVSESDGDVFWESPWGVGRPGWHIECTAMSMNLLSSAFSSGFFDPSTFETIDMHTGGVDNLFPHHEDEVAQSEGATGIKFVKYWLHAEHLIVDGKKMSKSLGNYFTVRDILSKGVKPTSLRYVLLSTHYRQQLNFTMELLVSADSAVSRLQEFVWKLFDVKGKDCDDLDDFLDEAKEVFESSLDDDLNMPSALAGVFKLVREVNTLIDADKLNSEGAMEIISFLRRVDSILGVLSFEKGSLSEKIEELMLLRVEARNKKDFKTADLIRDELRKMGVILDDTKAGVRWRFQ